MVIGLAAAGALLAGCASEQPGAAVTFTGGRFTESEVGQRARACEELLATSQQSATSTTAQAAVTQGVLSAMTFDLLLGAAAQSQGVTITPTQTAEAAAKAQAQLASDPRNAQYLETIGTDGLVQLQTGCAPDGVEALGRSEALQVALLDKLGAGTDRQAAITQATGLLADQAATLDVKVNPRFGTFDPQQLAITPPSSDLSKALASDGAADAQGFGGSSGSGG